MSFNFFKFCKGMFCSDIAIDLGSEMTRVYVKEEGLKVSEPTLVAVREIYPEKEFFQHGKEAAKLIGRTPKGIEVVRPVRRGAIVEIQEVESIIETAIKHVSDGTYFRPSPKVMVAISSSASEVEKKALEDAVYNAGARDVYFIKKGIAAAIGAGIDISSEIPSCVIDIGGETTEIAIIASSGIVYSKTFDVGGYDLAKGIEDSIRERMSIDIGIENATMLKKNLVKLIDSEVDQSEKLTIKAKDVGKKRPVKVEISQVDVYLGVYNSVEKILNAIDEVFEETSAETLAAFYQNGITIVGGSSRLNGLEDLISNYTGVKTQIADDPENCVIRGAGLVLEGEREYLSY